MVLSTAEELALCKALNGEGLSDAELEALNGLGRCLMQRRASRAEFEAMRKDSGGKLQ